jgi:hypothetical protein
MKTDYMKNRQTVTKSARESDIQKNRQRERREGSVESRE